MSAYMPSRLAACVSRRQAPNHNPARDAHERPAHVRREIGPVGRCIGLAVLADTDLASDPCRQVAFKQVGVPVTAVDFGDAVHKIRGVALERDIVAVGAEDRSE